MSGKNKLDGRILYGLKKPQEIKTGIMMEKCRKIISKKHSARSGKAEKTVKKQDKLGQTGGA